MTRRSRPHYPGDYAHVARCPKCNAEAAEKFRREDGPDSHYSPEHQTWRAGLPGKLEAEQLRKLTLAQERACARAQERQEQATMDAIAADAADASLEELQAAEVVWCAAYDDWYDSVPAVSCANPAGPCYEPMGPGHDHPDPTPEALEGRTR